MNARMIAALVASYLGDRDDIAEATVAEGADASDAIVAVNTQGGVRYLLAVTKLEQREGES